MCKYKLMDNVRSAASCGAFMHRFPAQTDSLTTIDESKPRMMNFSLEKKIFREKIFCSMLDWSLCVNPFHC